MVVDSGVDDVCDGSVAGWAVTVVLADSMAVTVVLAESTGSSGPAGRSGGWLVPTLDQLHSVESKLNSRTKTPYVRVFGDSTRRF